YNFSQENDDISNIFYPALNTKIGAEFRFGTFRARGGFAYLGSPYKEVSMKNIEDVYTPSDNTAIENTYKLQYSLGIGFRGENFFLDIAQVFQTHEVPYNLYDDPNGAYQYNPNMAIASNVTELSSLLSRTMVTVGFRF
ncbi:MAG: hypothetical protein MI922_14015, partial [Bacteroidales bacterium]|nr:hypothetical protein [Bacteroidales bacterium]